MALPNTLSPVGYHWLTCKGYTTTNGFEQDGSKCMFDHGDDNGDDNDDPKNYVTVLYVAEEPGLGGALSVRVFGYPAAIVTSKGKVVCGGLGDTNHTDSVAMGGSPSVFIEGHKVHRVNDWGVNPGGGIYNLATGSPNVLSG